MQELTPSALDAPAAQDRIHASFSVEVRVRIRACREDDLPALEWFGLFAAHRPLIRSTFERHQRGEALMLVAEAGGEASGQLWIDFGADVAEIWAVRILPCLQGRGIGSRLLEAAESAVRGRGVRRVELAVEIGEERARRFYERAGYRFTGTGLSRPQPRLREQVRTQQWMLAKDLAARGRTA